MNSSWHSHSLFIHRKLKMHATIRPLSPELIMCSSMMEIIYWFVSALYSKSARIKTISMQLKLWWIGHKLPNVPKSFALYRAHKRYRFVEEKLTCTFCHLVLGIFKAYLSVLQSYQLPKQTTNKNILIIHPHNYNPSNTTFSNVYKFTLTTKLIRCGCSLSQSFPSLINV